MFFLPSLSYQNVPWPQESLTHLKTRVTLPADLLPRPSIRHLVQGPVSPYLLHQLVLAPHEVHVAGIAADAR